VLNSSQVFWTVDVEKALTDGGTAGLSKYYDELIQQRSNTVKLVQGKLGKL